MKSEIEKKMGKGGKAKADDSGDVYGQVHPEESERFCTEKLMEFDAQLEALPKSDKGNVCEAEARCPELLTPSFKLMFLRCDVFQVDVSFDLIS